MNEHEVKIDPAQLRTLRESRAWSQEQLADIAGLNVRTVQRVEASGTASLETRMALAAALGIQPETLIKRSEAQPDLYPRPQLDEQRNIGSRISMIDSPASRDRNWVVAIALVLVVVVLLWQLAQRMGAASGAANAARCQEHPERCQ